VKDKCPEWPIIPEQDESPIFGYMLERQVGKRLRILLYFGYRSEENRKNYKACCYILATCSRLKEIMKNTKVLITRK
jgi:hypothetical protein